MVEEIALPHLPTLAQRLQFARTRNKKHTQKVVADKFGITDKAVSEWERGEGRPDFGRVVALATLYQVPVEWLMSDDPLPESELDLLTLIAKIRAWEPNQREPMLRILKEQIKLGQFRVPPSSLLGEMEEPPI